MPIFFFFHALEKLQAPFPRPWKIVREKFQWSGKFISVFPDFGKR